MTLSAGNSARQLLQILDVGAAPAVDRLVVVAHCRKLGTDTGQQLEQLVLAGVGILIFIDQQVAQAVLPFLGDLRMLGEQLHRQADQIVEIHRLISFQRRLVRQVGVGGQRFMFVGSELAGGFRRDQRILPIGNDRLQAAQRRLVDALGDVADDAGAIRGVKDREARLVAERLGLFAQDAHTERVEGRNLQFFGSRPRQELADPFLHFLRRLVGEGDGGHVARLEAAVLHQIGDLLRDHPRLARAGAGQHQQGAVKVVDRFALLGIEAGHGQKSGSESTRDTATGKGGDIKAAPRRSGAR